MLKQLLAGLGVITFTIAGVATVATASAATPTLTTCAATSGEIKVTLTGECPPGQKLQSWQSSDQVGAPGSGALQVYDANGILVGQLFGPSAVLLNPTGIQVVALRLTPTIVAGGAGFSGFDDSPSPPESLYTSSDCTGTRYLLAGTSSIHHNTLYFSQVPFEDIEAGSIEYPGDPATCMNMSGKIRAGIAATFDMSTLGVMPPFTVR